MSEPNYDSMSQDELLALVQREWVNQSQPPADPSQGPPRDEQGRFVAQPKQDEPSPSDIVEETVYRQVIDLGDGSGVQVFEAESTEALIEKLAEAQRNATRKIREQEARLKNAKPPEAPAPKIETEADKFLRQQQMLADPDRYIQEQVNRQLREAREAEQRAAEEAQREADEATKVAADWVKNHEGYFANDRNGARMEKYLSTYQLDATPENFDRAYKDLSEGGLLEARPTETPDGNNGSPASAQPRIEEVRNGFQVVRRKVAGGISTKRSAPVPTENTSELSEEQLYKMPLHELEALTYKSIR